MGELTDYFKRAKISVEETQHIKDFLGCGSKDPDWLQELSKHPDQWIVVTADAGKSGGDKLPRVAASLGVTHIVLTPHIHNSPASKKWLALTHVVPQIPLLLDLQPGTTVKLVMDMKRGGIESYALKVNNTSILTILSKKSLAKAKEAPNEQNMTQSYLL